VLLLLIVTTSMLRKVIKMPIVIDLLIRAHIVCLVGRNVLKTLWINKE